MSRSELAFLIILACLALLPIWSWPSPSAEIQLNSPQQDFLGYDRNEYPGDAALPLLRKTFAFTSYWIGPPPGEQKSAWLGKRALLRAQGFGFVVLFNGPETRALGDESIARQKGMIDGKRAVELARQEGFPKHTVVFLDIEEGGRLPAAYHEYVKSWSGALEQSGFRAGVYCSGVPVREGKNSSISTAKNIEDNSGGRELVFWVFNDVCPPSPGCSFPKNAPPPTQSGFAASVWQYAQSPRRKERTAHCAAAYAADGNCYAPGDVEHKWFLDANVASWADPSSGR